MVKVKKGSLIIGILSSKNLDENVLINLFIAKDNNEIVIKRLEEKIVELEQENWILKQKIQ